jgi:hypothetical protein
VPFLAVQVPRSRVIVGSVRYQDGRDALDTFESRGDATPPQASTIKVTHIEQSSLFGLFIGRVQCGGLLYGLCNSRTRMRQMRPLNHIPSECVTLIITSLSVGSDAVLRSLLLPKPAHLSGPCLSCRSGGTLSRFKRLVERLGRHYHL